MMDCGGDSKVYLTLPHGEDDIGPGRGSVAGGFRMQIAHLSLVPDQAALHLEEQAVHQAQGFICLLEAVCSRVYSSEP